MARSTKGKTYLEIYGTSTPPCGFKSGDDNIAKRPEVRKKISEAIKKSYTPALREQRGQFLREHNLKNGYAHGKKKVANSQGQLFRSRLEARFSDLLAENNIAYQYEVPLKLNSGHYKIVDFTIGNLLIEITGFAYDGWQKDFCGKMEALRDTVKSKILVLTETDRLEKAFELIADTNLFIGDVGDEVRIIKTIGWLQEW